MCDETKMINCNCFSFYTFLGALTFHETNLLPIPKLRKTLKLSVDIVTYDVFSI